MRTPLRLILTAFGFASALAAATLPAAMPAADPTTAAKAAADSARGVTQAAGDLSQSNSVESKTVMKIMDKVFLTDGGNVNPETGAIMWRNHTYSPEQSRLFRSRFERYLSLSAGPEQNDYIALLDRIAALLSTGTSAAGNPAAVREAWQLLYEAADYPADGRTSLNVANQVFNTWRVRDEKTAMEITAVELERLRQKQISEIGTNLDKTVQTKTGETWLPLTGINNEVKKRPDQMPDSATPDDINKAKAPIVAAYAVSQIAPALGANNAGEKGVGNTTGRDSTKSRELAETEQKIQALQAQKQTTLTEAKLQFQAHMLNLFLQRRFQHCLISAAFYRFIFKGSAQKMEVGQQDIAEFLPSSNVPITVDTLEYLARQALTEAKDGMEAVRNDYQANRRLAALERLQESFFLGEFTSEIIRFDAGQRQALNAIYQKMAEAKGAANAKDYAAVLRLVGDLNGLTGDFKSAELVGSIQAAQELSNINVRGAQQASAQGDFDKTESFVAKAAAIWPTNPALRDFTSRAATMSEGVVFFDDAYAAGELRRIFNKKETLAVTLARDSARLSLFKATLDKMTKVEAALVQTEAMLAQNNPYAAWETLLAVTPLVPDDPLLNQKKAKLAPRVADFVNALDRAERAETGHEPAASLAHYLAAQDLYPASVICHDGLERVSARLLAQLGKDTPSPSKP